MLKINRIKAISHTESCNYGFDYIFKDRLNLVSSSINTRGKSSVLLTIYYCLGFEEIIGGKGKKTLTSVYKTVVEDENHATHKVIGSEMWLEITNGVDTIAINRTAEMKSRNENLITVYHSNLDNVYFSETYVEDMYVHAANSATSSRGFHSFLEKFIGFDLPLVPSNDGVEYKLYMQLLFSAIFIEQKRGWADIFSAMPVFGIKDSKKRVIEYILDLDTLCNEKKRANLKLEESSIMSRWVQLYKEVESLCTREDCRVYGLPMKPCILDSDFPLKLTVVTIADNIAIADKLCELNRKRKKFNHKTPKIVENFDELQSELEKTESSINILVGERRNMSQTLFYEKATIKRLEENLNTIDVDLRNNKDAQKLKKMGSEIGITSNDGYCPLCGQVIQDSLLPIQNSEHTMSIEENISHLGSQQAMVRFAISAHRQKIEELEITIRSLSQRLSALRRLAKTIRSDLYSVDENLSETVVYERISIENEIQALSRLSIEIKARNSLFMNLSAEWENHLVEKETLPKSNFTQKDKGKIEAFEENFKNYLRAFNYQSSSYDSIQISRENYLPISEGFDMKFDSSASDNIRAIWAYTLALLKTSNEKGGNHPQIVLFDEPGQHSIVTKDMISLFQKIIDLPSDNQVILGITLNDNEIRKAVEEIDKSKVHIVDVGDHAFVTC